MTANAPARTVDPAERFGFGRNWQRFLASVDDARIAAAERSLAEFLGVARLDGQRFLDIGSGSGLFSLAARRLGAHVDSVDFDPESVACARHLRQTHFPNDPDWTVQQGSVLDRELMSRLGPADIVYSWGVLHHTGALWEAFGNALAAAAPGGLVFVALYNDQGWISRYWTVVKRLYNRSAVARALLLALHAPVYVGLRWLWQRLRGRKPERGMNLWHDLVDWLGGWPFEVATPAAVTAFAAACGFDSVRTRTVGRRHGCNEFLFRRRRALPASFIAWPQSGRA